MAKLVKELVLGNTFTKTIYVAKSQDFENPMDDKEWNTIFPQGFVWYRNFVAFTGIQGIDNIGVYWLRILISTSLDLEQYSFLSQRQSLHSTKRKLVHLSIINMQLSVEKFSNAEIFSEIVRSSAFSLVSCLHNRLRYKVGITSMTDVFSFQTTGYYQSDSPQIGTGTSVKIIIYCS